MDTFLKFLEDNCPGDDAHDGHGDSRPLLERCGMCNSIYKAHQKELDVTNLQVEELRGALRWMSGSRDFQPGGYAREGFLKIQHLLHGGTDSEKCDCLCHDYKALGCDNCKEHHPEDAKSERGEL